MAAERIDLKNPLLAAALAWFIPGLGHAYQGRWFKAVLYSACIWGTWGCGWVLGDGKVVYFNRDMKRGRWTAGYAAQVMIGSAALPAIYQTRRASPDGAPENRDQIVLTSPLAGDFDGELVGVRFTDGRGGYFRVHGRLEIEPSDDGTFRKSVTGKFQGTVHPMEDSDSGVPDGAAVELTLNYLESLEPQVFPSPHRELRCGVEGVVNGPKGGHIKSADLNGKVLNVRGLLDRYAAPLDAEGLQEAHGELGKYFEIALVYTWIAGLLNLLAIWDAYEGPAYGFGDEEPTPTGGQLGPAPATAHVADPVVNVGKPTNPNPQLPTPG